MQMRLLFSTGARAPWAAGKTMIGSLRMPRSTSTSRYSTSSPRASSAATLVLIGENLGKDPAALGDFIAEKRISVWYSAPTILSLLARARRIWTGPGYRAPRLVLFAGEVFPLAALRRLRSLWPDATDVEPLRADRDQRLHGLPDSPYDPGRSHRSVSDRLGLPSACGTRRRRARPRRGAGRSG